MKNRYSFSIWVFVLMISGAMSLQAIHAQKITYPDSWNKAGFNLQAENRAGVTVGFSVEEFTIAPASINGRAMSNIELPGFWLPNNEGAPNLPGGGRYIAMPNGAVPVMEIKAMRKEIYRNVEVAPAPRIPLDTDLGPLEYNFDAKIYQQDAFYPESPVMLSEITEIRGVDVVLLGITPFQYNPVTKELIVYRDIEVQVRFEGGDGQFGEERLRSRFWDPILTDAVLNSQSIPAIDYSQRAISNRSNDGWEYLIIVPDGADFMTYAQQIKTFRIKQGITTEIKTLTEIGGNNVATIEAYINNAYNTWDPAPAAILFMADYGTDPNTNIVAPIWDNYCASDNIFVDVNNDDLPDIVSARMTANNATQLETFVSKFLNYETDPPTNPDFYDHPITALGWQTERWFQICSETVGGYFKNVHGKNPVRINEIYGGNPNSDPWSTAQNTSTVLGVFGPNGLGYIPATPQSLGGWSGGNATMINNAINSGAFILQHRDHGMETGWGEPSYTNANIDGLNNTDLSFIFSINCLTGKYNWSNECFTEKFHRYKYNNQNSGALGLIGASEVSYSFVNDTYVWGMFDNMWPDFMPQYGPMGNIAERGLLPGFGNAAGKYFLQQSSWPYNTNNKTVTYHLFHLHGDAFMTLYSEVPQDLTIIHDGVILAGLNEFTVTVDEGATVCLTVGDNIIGLAQGTGAPVTIPITPQNAGTEVVLTITKTNFYRHEETIQVIPATGAYCIYGTHIVQDTSGNNNGLADYNETILLNLSMRNVGMANAENVEVTLSTNDPYVTMIDDNEPYSTIPAGQSVSIPFGFEFYVAENTPDQHKVYFDIVSTDGTNVWNSLFVMNVNAPVLRINALTINDDDGGNGNGLLDPGEQVTMTVNYSNVGHATAYGVDVHMEGQSGFVEVLNPSQSFAFIGFFGVFNKTFDVTVDENAPEGIVVDFVNDLTMGNFFMEKTYCEKICPLIEDFETGNFTKFEWESAGNMDWTVSNVYPYQGNFSAKSGAISHNQSTELIIQMNVMSNDSVKFVKKVSSEPNDKLQFFIGNTMMGEWFGTSTGWGKQSFPVTAGNRTLRWVFTKNSSVSSGSDCAWLDNIELPGPMCLTLWAGPDSDVCESGSITLTESYGTAYSTLSWSTDGDGTFNDNTMMHPVYTPGTMDIENGSATLSLTLWDTQGESVTDEMLLNIMGTPGASPMPTGPDYVDLFTTTTSIYSTEGIEDLEEYAWYLSPAEAGTIEGSTNKATVYWDAAYLGTALVSVAAINECGEGELSQAFEVTVDNTVGLGEPGSENLGLSIYPNPGNGTYQLLLNTPEESRIRLNVFNLLGEKVYEDHLVVDGRTHHTLSLDNLPDGIYILRMEGNDLSVSRKIAKR